uniref:Transcription factor Adf-1 n=1 Tax=Bactrocera dorsalis TaxID=27457 RepID=A0A034W8H0_BACDO
MEAYACSVKDHTEHYYPYGMVIRKTKALKEDQELCNLVEQHPQLYSKRHKYYGQKKATDEAWRTIAFMLGKSAHQCKDRWEKMCAEYTAYLRSVDAEKEQRRLSRLFKDYLDFLKLLCLTQDMTQYHISISKVIHEITEMKSSIDSIQNVLQEINQKRKNKNYYYESFLHQNRR